MTWPQWNRRSSSSSRKATPYAFHVTSVTEGQVERSSKPEAIALGVFGAIAALVALLIGGQAISRALWASVKTSTSCARSGPTRLTVTWDAILGLLGAVVLGALWPWCSPWRSRPWRRSGRRARSTRRRGSPSTGPCSARDSPSWPSVSVP